MQKKVKNIVSFLATCLQVALDSFARAVSSAVADGGPVEQRALFDISPLGESLGAGEDPLFPNLGMITRDRPHRHRSVLRGAWKSLHQPVQDLLQRLVTGERSLAKLLQTSVTYAKLFEEAQEESKRTSGPHFSQTIRNLAFAEQRYDSRSRPLFRLFTLLPVAIDVLQKLTKVEKEDAAKCAKEILSLFAGDEGFVRVIGAAVAADAMCIGWQYIRLDDAEAADFSLTGPRAAELLHTMRAMLLDGGLFLAEASGTLTHQALCAMRGRLVWLGSDAGNAVALRWPSPHSPARRQPIRMAREHLGLHCVSF